MIEIHPCKEIKLSWFSFLSSFSHLRTPLMILISLKSSSHLNLIFFGANQNNLAFCHGLSVPLLKRRVIAIPPWEPWENAPKEGFRLLFYGLFKNKRQALNHDITLKQLM